MANIKRILRGYICDEREKNWTKEYAKREIERHKTNKILDHPDESVTTKKLAKGCVTKEKLESEITELIEQNKEGVTNLAAQLQNEIQERVAVDNLKADKATTLLGYGIEDAYNKAEVNDKLLAIDGRYKTAEYSDIDSLYEPCIYHITDNDKHNGWLLVTYYTEEYQDPEYGTMVGNAFSQLYFHSDDKYVGVLEKRTGTNGRWNEWVEIGSGSGTVTSVNGQVGDVNLNPSDVGAAWSDLSNVSDEDFLYKLNIVLPDGDEVSY